MMRVSLYFGVEVTLRMDRRCFGCVLPACETIFFGLTGPPLVRRDMGGVNFLRGGG